MNERGGSAEGDKGTARIKKSRKAPVSPTLNAWFL